MEENVAFQNMVNHVKTNVLTLDQGADLLFIFRNAGWYDVKTRDEYLQALQEAVQ